MNIGWRQQVSVIALKANTDGRTDRQNGSETGDKCETLIQQLVIKIKKNSVPEVSPVSLEV